MSNFNGLFFIFLLAYYSFATLSFQSCKLQTHSTDRVPTLLLLFLMRYPGTSHPFLHKTIITCAHWEAYLHIFNNTVKAWRSSSMWWNNQRNSDFSQGECCLEEHAVLFRWTAVSGSQERSWGSLTGASKRQHQRNDLKCEKESIIILQNKAFSNMANVTGFWQHYLGFILSKRAPPQGWNKKPWYVILWNGKMTEEQAQGIQDQM